MTATETLLTISPSQVAALRGMTLETAEYHYGNGRIGQASWEAYAHAWRTGAVRYSSLLSGYANHDSLDSDAQAIATELGCCKTLEG